MFVWDDDDLSREGSQDQPTVALSSVVAYGETLPSLTEMGLIPIDI